MEVDPFPFSFYGQLYATREGEIVAISGAFYRISADGEVLAMRGAPTRGSARGPASFFDDRCGVGFIGSWGTSANRLAWVRGRDFDAEIEITNTLPAAASTATPDCGLVENARPSRDALPTLRRLREDGSIVFEHVSRYDPDVIVLADDSLLLVRHGTSRNLPGITVLSPTGEVRLDRDFDPAEVGDEIVDRTAYVSPDGVLYFATSVGLGEVQRIVAVEIGTPPRTPYLHADSGLHWSHANATWAWPASAL